MGRGENQALGAARRRIEDLLPAPQPLAATASTDARMGRLPGGEDGVKTNSAGVFVREVSGFRRWVTVDGRPGPPGEWNSRRHPSAITSLSTMPVPGPTAP